jgi:dihydropyrimidine dehydrogenase (NAD+) subunit PreA
MIVSLMLPCEEAPWREILPLVEATGADGIELNFGCPHGMPERGMGAAVGQVPDLSRWSRAGARSYTKLPSSSS